MVFSSALTAEGRRLGERRCASAVAELGPGAIGGGVAGIDRAETFGDISGNDSTVTRVKPVVRVAFRVKITHEASTFPVGLSSTSMPLEQSTTTNLEFRAPSITPCAH